MSEVSPRTRPMRKFARGLPGTMRRCSWSTTPSASAAESLLGGARPDARHAPGKRRRHAVLLRHLLFFRDAAPRRGGVKGSLRERAQVEGTRFHHYRDRSGAGVLFRRGLPPAISRQGTRTAIAGLVVPASHAPSARALGPAPSLSCG